jgi:choice-of-anchor B domain-containing protein
MIRRSILSSGLIAAVVCASFATAHDGDPKLLDRRPVRPGSGWRNAQRLVPPAPTQVPGTAVTFAHQNVTLLSWLSLPDLGLPAGGGGNGASCFGYTSPSGREYALMCLSNRLVVVEITHPGDPQIVSTIPGNPSLWRDVRTFGHYAYVVTENAGGIQVVDLSNVDNGQAPLVNTVMTGGTGNTHTIEINTQSGYLYRAGGMNNGLRIYDLNADPIDPPFVGQWSDRYVHEAQVVSYPGREIAICCGGLNTGHDDTGIDIVDVTDKANPVLMLHVVYGSPGYSHQAALSPDRQFLYHDDETDGRPFTRVFDASSLGTANPTLPFLGEFQNGTTVDHNLNMRGMLVFESNYTSGLRVFDRTSSSVAPTLVAWFDTHPDDDGPGYHGLWNNYPSFPSGTVIGSDMERGLFVWWVGAPPVTFSFPNGVPAALDPAGDTLLVQIDAQAPGITAGSAKLWTSTGGAWTASDLVSLGGNLWSAVFSPVACGTDVQFYVTAQTANQVQWSAPEAAFEQPFSATSATSATVVVGDGFQNPDNWITPQPGDTATQGQWVRADPVGTAAQPEDDHTSGTGTICWITGNGLVGGAADAADVDNGTTTLRSRRYDLSATTNAVVSYWRWYSNDQGTSPNADVLKVDVSNNDGAFWVNVETVGPAGSETSGGWYKHAFRVSDFVAPTNQVRLRFVAQDTGGASTVEAAIDDFSIVDASCAGASTFCAGDGTASACPCGNFGASGAGCASSGGIGGTLGASGTPSVAADTLVLSAGSLPPTASVLFFQGTTQVNGGLGAAFGDGLSCAGGMVVRLATRFASSGSASYPEAGDAAISVKGTVPAGASRAYQAWYRNTAPFCTTSTFNLTNGVAVSWGN